jgi:hypothetical protein
MLPGNALIEVARLAANNVQLVLRMTCGPSNYCLVISKDECVELDAMRAHSGAGYTRILLE